MSRCLLFIFLYIAIVPTTWAAVTFSAGNDRLLVDSTTSSSTPVNTGLAVSLGGYTGDALVVSSFSGEKTNNSEPVIAQYQLAYNGSVIGQPRFRNIQKSSAAAGAGSSVGVVTISNSNDITLQHAENNSKANLTTLTGSTLSVIPLTSGATTLNHAHQSVLDPSASTTGSSFSQVTATSSFSVPAVHSGTSEIFVMASFGVSADQSGSGSWQLQVRDVATGTWVNVGNQAQRAIGTSEGIVTVVGLADVSAAGSYEARLLHASDGTAQLSTTNIDLVALSLSIGANEYLQSYEATTIGATGASLSIPVGQDMQVFAAANITANSSNNDTGTYLLNLNDGASTNLISSSTREVDSANLGSVALSGVVSLVASNSNTLEMSVDSANLGFSSDSNLVAFGLTSVPEHSSIAWISALVVLIFALRKRSSKQD